MRIIECSSETASSSYTPPPLGNGDLSMPLDMEGIQRQKSYHKEFPAIWRAGRRYNDAIGRPMIPFGYIGHGVSCSPECWRQRLDVETASVASNCDYANGMSIQTEAFIHLNHPVIAIRKSGFSGAYSFKYILAQPGESKALPGRMRLSASNHAHGVDISYEIEGLKERQGLISLLCDQPVEVSIDNNEFTLKAESGPASFFLIFSDDFDGDAFPQSASELKALAMKEGYDGLFSSHKAAWSDYWRESYVEMPSRKEAEVYAAAQYHLRISSTRWSIPAGGISNHWQGTYFAFDEFFPFMALATSGHMDIARRIPEFRHAVLKKACLRSFQHWGEEDSADYGARYHWMSDENGEECAPHGYWLEHIFHMAHVALCAWNLYRYAGDISFLRDKGYPVMARCAEFYRTQSLYELGDGRIIVGKCTDLERLGPARENTFMTSCGVIATFEAAAMAAELLGIDSAKADVWRRLAGKLRESLPSEAERYVPHPDCKKKSIAVFAGTFPYPVLPTDDPLQLRAIADFIDSESDYGNMYPVGNSVCVWYIGWKGIAFARLGKLDEAHECIRRSCCDTNSFSEIFEISNPPMRPWFTSGEGVFIQLLNECLLQSSEGEIRILKYPADNYAFKLAAVGAVMVEASFADGKIVKLGVEAKQPYEGGLTLPDGRNFKLKLDAGATIALI